MQNTRQSAVNTIALASLLASGGYVLPATAQSKSAAPVYVSDGLLPKQTAYDCGNAGAITLTRDAKNHDRFTYEAVNTRGQKLTIRNGVGYTSSGSTIYTFLRKNGSQFIITQTSDNKSMLTTGGKDVKDTSFNCKVTKTTVHSPRNSSSRSGLSSEFFSMTRPAAVTVPISQPAPVSQPVEEAALASVRSL